MKVTCHIISCVIARAITGISWQHFMKTLKTYQTFLKKYIKILKMYPLHPRLPPPPQKSSKYPQGKGNTPHKVFQSDVHQSIIKNICPKFLKKPNDSQKIEKNTTGKTKQYSKMAWRRGGLTVKFFFQCSNNWWNTKNIFANFYEKQFSGSQKMEENHQNAVPK